MAATAMIWYRW